MAMFGPIPLPGIDNPQFKDVMDYWEQIQKRKALQHQAAQELAQKDSQFGISNDLDRQKLAELAKFHNQSLAQGEALNPLKMELLRTKIESLKNSGQSVQDKYNQKLKDKRLDDIEKQANDLAANMNNAVDATDILEKNPAATGYTPAMQNWVGKGSEETGALNDIFGGMQASLAKDYSSRGSVYGTKLAGNRKPSLKNDYEQNIGTLNQIHKDYFRRYKQMSEDYKRLSGGKDLPISLHDFYRKVKVISPKGDEVIKTPEEAEVLLAKYPGSIIKGNAYE